MTVNYLAPPWRICSKTPTSCPGCKFNNDIALLVEPSIPRLPRPTMRHVHIKMSKNLWYDLVDLGQSNLHRTCQQQSKQQPLHRTVCPSAHR